MKLQIFCNVFGRHVNVKFDFTCFSVSLWTINWNKLMWFLRFNYEWVSREEAVGVAMNKILLGIMKMQVE